MRNIFVIGEAHLVLRHPEVVGRPQSLSNKQLDDALLDCADELGCKQCARLHALIGDGVSFHHKDCGLADDGPCDCI